MEEKNTENAKIVISPKFNFIYELFMPTGIKIKTSFFMIIMFSILTIFVVNYVSLLEIMNMKIFNDITFSMILIIFSYCMLGISIIKFLFHIVFQMMQYKYISYSFYDNHMTYKDDFLNQHRKNILYENIKEVEIRRTIWDRILKFGIIVVYTSAENEKSNGLVIYGVKNPDKFYDEIDILIHSKKNISNNIESIKSIEVLENKNVSDKIEEVENEEEFKKSLQNIKKE